MLNSRCASLGASYLPLANTQSRDEIEIIRGEKGTVSSCKKFSACEMRGLSESPGSGPQGRGAGHGLVCPTPPHSIDYILWVSPNHGVSQCTPCHHGDVILTSRPPANTLG